MALNYGLLGDMASGIKEGMIAYQTKRNMDRQDQMANLMNGVQQNQDTGSLEFTPQQQQIRDLQNNSGFNLEPKIDHAKCMIVVKNPNGTHNRFIAYLSSPNHVSKSGLHYYDVTRDWSLCLPGPVGEFFNQTISLIPVDLQQCGQHRRFNGP